MRQRCRPVRALARIAARSLAVALFAMVAVGCTPPLDTDGLEARLRNLVSEEIGASITAVDCPDVKAETGGVFECTATDESGATITLKVTQTDDQGHVVYDYR